MAPAVAVTSDHTSLDFADVVAAAAHGENWALTQLFRTYQPLLLRYLRSQESGAADDLAGEVWIAVARGLNRFAGDELGFRRWLFTIARCRLMEHRRRQARQRTQPVAPERLDRLAGPVPTGDPCVPVIEQMTAQEAIALVVASLTPDQAEAVLLRIVAGFGVAEVALLMGRSEVSVRVLCHRARRRLRARFPEGVLIE